MKMAACISVLIPVYNGEKYLRRTLSSIVKQNFADFEVILMDDCSTDNSADIIKEFTSSDDRFLYFRTEANCGIVPKVLNHAIQHMSGEFFAYSSQDDFFLWTG